MGSRALAPNLTGGDEGADSERVLISHRLSDRLVSRIVAGPQAEPPRSTASGGLTASRAICIFLLTDDDVTVACNVDLRTRP
jgi:hypothetical protein